MVGRDVFTVLFFLVQACQFLDCAKVKGYCYSDDESPYEYFGIATPYDYVRRTLTEPKSVSRCEKIQIWMLVRHGTRYGLRSNVNKMKLIEGIKDRIIDNYKFGHIQNGLCEKDLSAIRIWTWDNEIEKKVGQLNEQGEKDNINLSKRYKRKHPELFGSYSPEKYHFGHTWYERTEQSCKSFIDGLFGEGANKNVTIDKSSETDFLLKPYDYCPAWSGDVEGNSKTWDQATNFQHSERFTTMARDVSRRLGFNTTLKVVEIESMYDNCRFDRARYLDRKSPWCAVFKRDDMIVLEYAEELIRYYMTSYGHDYNPKLGCVPLKNLKETFEKTVSNAGIAQPKVVAFFTHDSTMDMVYANLGYARDDKPLTGASIFKDRKYRNSLNIPFVANIAAVLYKCTSGYKVQLSLNEGPLEIDGCPNGLCNWSWNFLHFAKECDIGFCNSTRTG